MTILARRSFPNIWDEFFDRNLLSDFFETEEKSDVPAVNIAESENNYRIEVATPGMKKEDFNIHLEDNVLGITSKIKTDEKKKENFLRREFCYTCFKRSFTLPDSVKSDDIKATFENGILYVNIPKKEEAIEKAPRQIAVS